MKRTWLKALAIVGGIALLLVMLLLNSFYWAPLGAFRDWVLGPNELGRFAWESLTGPPAAGALAVTAAWIAYGGIKKQVAEQKVANENAVAVAEETKRKNLDEQWWKTLEWAYTEAKTFTEKTATKPRGIIAFFGSRGKFDASSGQQRTKETGAIIAILRSLAQSVTLSDLQKTTVAEVLGIFDDSSDPGVQHQVDDALIDLGRTSGSPDPRQTVARAVEYEKGLLAALEQIDPKVGHLTGEQSVRSGDGNLTYDGIVRTTSKHLIAIEAKYRLGRPLDRRQLAVILAYLPDEGEGFQYQKRDIAAPLNVDQILIVANTPLTDSARGMLERQASKVGYAVWNLGDPIDEIQQELNRLAKVRSLS